MGRGDDVTPSQLSEDLREAVETFRQRAGIERVFVFGSRVEGEANDDSDVDLLLVDARWAGVRACERSRGLDKHWPIEEPVDFLCFTPEEFDRLRGKPTLVRNAVEQGVAVG